MDFKTLYKNKLGTVEKALGFIQSNDVVVLAGDGNAPVTIAKRIHEIAPSVENVVIFKDFTNYFPFPTLDGMNGHIFSQGFFYGKDLREGLPKGNSSYFPSDICAYGSFIALNKPTCFIVATTPMNDEGDFEIGLCNMWEKESLDAVLANGGRIIVEANKNIPHVNGAVKINIRDVTVVTETEAPLTLIPPTTPSEEEKKVAANVRSLLKDGDCVQFGIGALPNAIADLCMDLKDLGMHTEMLTTAMGKMVKEGVVNGSRKNFRRGEHVFTFVGGNQELFDSISENENYRVVPASYGCNPFVISQNDNVVSINTCIEMDLMGQIASEAIGTRQYSGSGGAFCYAYGAMLSKGGRGIMAFTSTTGKGYTKIKAMLGEGSTVTIPRNYSDYIVTEYGIARMRGKTLKERATQLIAIAHPDCRDELTFQAKKLMWI